VYLVVYLQSIVARWLQSLSEPDGNVAGGRVADRGGAPHAPGHVCVDLFFGFTATISIVSFIYTPLVVWSVFANILYLPLLLAMFWVE
jgi:hypothetical protein